MRFNCENCGSRYSIADEKVAGKVVKIKCKKCGHLIRIEGKTKSAGANGEKQGVAKDKSVSRAAAMAAEKIAAKKAARAAYEKAAAAKSTAGKSAAAKSAAAKSAVGKPAVGKSAKPEEKTKDPRIWHISIKRVTAGPFTLAHLKKQYDAGEINKRTFVWKKGFSGWNVISNIDEIVDCFDGKTKPEPSVQKKPPIKEKIPAKKEIKILEEEQKPKPKKKKREVPDDIMAELSKETFQVKEEEKSIDAQKKIKTGMPPEKHIKKTTAERKLDKLERQIASTDEIDKPKSKEVRLKGSAGETGKAEKKRKKQSDDDMPDAVEELLAAIRETEDDFAHKPKTDKLEKPRTDEISGDELFEEEIVQEHPVKAEDPLADLFDEEGEEEDDDGELQDLWADEEAPPEAPRESTRIFIMAAGVSKRQRYRKIGIYIGASLVFLWSLGFVMTTFNVIDLDSLAAESAPAPSEKWEAGKSGLNIGWIFGQRPKQKKQQIASKRRRRSNAAVGSAVGAAGSVKTRELDPDDPLAGLADSLAGDQNAGGNRGAAGLLAEKTSRSTMDPFFKGSSLQKRRNLFDKDAPVIDLPGSRRKKNLPPELDAKTIKRVVSSNLPKLKGCYESELKRDPSLQGRINVSLTLTGEGTVSDVDLGKSNISGTKVESCMKKSLKRWRFPGFNGDATAIEFPIILAPGF